MSRRIILKQNGDLIEVRCYNRINNCSWIEDWDDLDITINAFIIKDYVFE